MRHRPTIAASDLARGFGSGPARVQVLRHLSLEISPGELTLIVGPSGSGKSTLLSILSGLLRPDAGLVMVLERDLWRLPAAEVDRFRLHHCGFVFQGFNLFSALTALQQVILPLQHLGVRGAEARRRALQALDEVGLGDRVHLRPAELSGGEKQRAAIARAIVKEPRLLFADEPTAALDARSGQVVIDILHRFARGRGATVLAVTHDPRLLGHADRVLTLEDGTITSDQRRSPAALPALVN